MLGSDVEIAEASTGLAAIVAVLLEEGVNGNRGLTLVSRELAQVAIGISDADCNGVGVVVLQGGIGKTTGVDLSSNRAAKQGGEAGCRARGTARTRRLLANRGGRAVATRGGSGDGGVTRGPCG